MIYNRTHLIDGLVNWTMTDPKKINHNLVSKLLQPLGFMVPLMDEPDDLLCETFNPRWMNP